MRKIFITLFVVFICFVVKAQNASNFTVNGDFDKFYPILFNDANWIYNKATDIEIGRSDIHLNSAWRGSMIANFTYHTYNWGHGSSFINANIHCGGGYNFVGGWKDATSSNGNQVIIIWLRGGGITYYLNSASFVNPIIYDGIQNVLPYQETNGPTHSFKTEIDNYVANYTTIQQNSAYFLGAGNNYFAGNVGIGTITPQEKLSVNGNIRAKEIKVEAANWPDYVFEENHKITSLADLEKYIKANKHLPDMPSAKEVESNGLELGEIVKQQQKIIEELTLHLIEKENQLNEERQVNRNQEQRLLAVEKLVKNLTITNFNILK